MVECADWIGKPMTDSRPAPQYGEYATPEQQAAAMGRPFVPPPDPATRVAVPAPMSDATPPSASVGPGGHVIDRFLTIFELGIAIVLLVSADFSHVAENANTALEGFGISHRIPVAIDHYAWLLLASNIVLLLATFVWAFAWLRRGRLAFYIPLVGYLVFSAVLGIAIGVSR